MVKHTWEKVADRKGDHRVFKNQDGRYAIADRSGNLPDQTDDGVIWLVDGGKAEVHISEFSKRLMVRYDIRVERYEARGLDAGGSCCSGLHVIPFLREVGYEISLSDTLAEDLPLVEMEVDGLLNPRGAAATVVTKEEEDQARLTYADLHAKINANKVLSRLSGEHLMALANLVKAFIK